MRIFEAYTRAEVRFWQMKKDTPGYNGLGGHSDMYYPIIKNAYSFDFPIYLQDLIWMQNPIPFAENQAVRLLLDEWRRVKKL